MSEHKNCTKPNCPTCKTQVDAMKEHNRSWFDRVRDEIVGEKKDAKVINLPKKLPPLPSDHTCQVITVDFKTKSVLKKENLA